MQLPEVPAGMGTGVPADHPRGNPEGNPEGTPEGNRELGNTLIRLAKKLQLQNRRFVLAERGFTQPSTLGRACKLQGTEKVLFSTLMSA